MNNKVLFQLKNSENEPVGLYLVPKKFEQKFEAIFQKIEKELVAMDEPDLHEAIDNYLSENYDVERIFAEEAQSNEL